MGISHVAIHPYANVRRSGAIPFEVPEKTGYLLRAADIAKAEGVTLFWKPHLAYWGTFQWRGAIDFGEDQAAWARFFSDYEDFIVAHARFAQARKIPIFSIGLEYKQTLRFEKCWRKIIQAVRRVYSGQLTYGANWDTVSKVPFWDALDLIGVQAYFPLSNSTNPSDAELHKGWDRVFAQLSALGKQHKKKVLFTEIGYARYAHAAKEPWKPAMDNSEATIALRRQLMKIAFERMDKSALVVGAFWWKWMPGRAPYDRDFSMKNPEARAALSEAW